MPQRALFGRELVGPRRRFWHGAAFRETRFGDGHMPSRLSLPMRTKPLVFAVLMTRQDGFQM